MRTKLVILIAASLVAALPMAAAQNASQNAEQGPGPGFVTPNSAIYGLEVAYDNAAVSVGLKKAEAVAQERAAEAEEMARRGNYKGAQKAADNMAKIAQKAKGNQTEGLRQAEQTLQRVMDNAPEEAKQGLQNALGKVEIANEGVENRPNQRQGPSNNSDRSENLREDNSNEDSSSSGQGGLANDSNQDLSENTTDGASETSDTPTQ